MSAGELPKGTRVGRYRIDGLIGRGGIALVYAAHEPGTGRRHAIKVLQVPSAQVRKRLLMEGTVLAELKHPNVVALHDTISVDDCPALVLELVRGAALDQLIRGRRLPLEAVDHIARGILDGVAAAHHKGMVHRDLKPSNVMLGLEGKSVVCKITDFGVAKVLSTQGSTLRTRTGALLGTPAFMAPEQIRSAKDVGPAADVFSLGGVLYQLVTGSLPFPGSSSFDVLAAVHRGEYTPPDEVVDDLPERMLHAIQAALHPDEADRPADAAALAKVWCGDEPAPVPGRWSRDLHGRVLEMCGDALPTTESQAEVTAHRTARIQRAAGWVAVALALGALLAWLRVVR
jgi:eukaryotic-like serine/threonine-protein kinase